MLVFHYTQLWASSLMSAPAFLVPWGALHLHLQTQENPGTSAGVSLQSSPSFDWSLFPSSSFAALVQSCGSFSLRDVADAWKLSGWLDAAISPDTSSVLTAVCACRWLHGFRFTCVCVCTEASSAASAGASIVSVKLCWKLPLDNATM